MNEFTALLRKKGWTVQAACDHWGIHLQTFYRRVNDKRYQQQMLDMCRGMKDREIGATVKVRDGIWG